MPILRGTASFARFRVEPQGGKTPDWKRTLAPGLRGRPFVPLNRQEPEERSVGFVELEDHDAQAFSPGALYQAEWAVFTWRVDEFRIPASQIKGELEKWSKAFEAENQRPPGRKEKLDAKQQLRQVLKATAPIASRGYDVSWNLQTGEMQIWATARKVVDEIQEVVEQAFSVKLRPLVPVVVADLLGIAEKSLAPTPLLSLPEKKEPTREQA